MCRFAVASGEQGRLQRRAARTRDETPELFGWAAAPAPADGRAPLTVHLLSPAGHPAAVTGDLASFWREGYRAAGPSSAAATPATIGGRTRPRPSRPGG
ncbi:ATP-dependent helicase C-terminal domain-containing protein [Streptomyces sp. NPDC014684]|uniref:ATP-dependent helicase C-terminal domain-containing protein n=1 Tax=Streptomyces sp. NPDC014684 TaxID=3364880 RepID=UPI0036FB0E7F